MEAATAVVSRMCDASRPGLSILRMPDGSLSVSGDPHASFRVLRHTGDVGACVSSIVRKSCSKAEAVGMGSTGFLVRALSHMLKQGEADAPAVLAVIRELPGISCPPSLSNIELCLRTAIPDVADLILEATALAGSECRIFVEPAVGDQTTVERSVGHTFNVQADPAFFRDGKWHATDVRCLVVDGIIDRVSEIDALLSACNALKCAAVILARGYSDEVLATLRLNYLRRTLNVVPVTVAFDLETANVLIDIAVVVGCDVVSSLKGEMVSTVKLADLPIARDVTCIGRSMTVVTGPAPNLQAHTKELVRRRNAENIPTMKCILDKRLRSLSGLSVVIRASDVGLQGSKLMHDIDSGLKVVRSILQHGTVDVARTSSIDGSGLLAAALGPRGVCPTLSLGAGLRFALSAYETLASAGVFLPR